MSNRFFRGPLFPDYWGATKFFGGLFPDPNPIARAIEPAGPEGLATFALELAAGVVVSLRWSTHVHKSESGIEQRASLMSYPRCAITGSGRLLGAGAHVQRALIDQGLVLGATFRVALAFDPLQILIDASVDLVNVNPVWLERCDWAVVGMRVVLRPLDRSKPQQLAVIQHVDFTYGTITLDRAVGSDSGKRGSWILPTIPMLLAPTQTARRFAPRDPVEVWTVAGDQLDFGFAGSALPAALELADVVGSGALDQVRVLAVPPGVAGNQRTLALEDDGLSGIDIDDTGLDTVIHYQAGSTLGDIVAAITSRTYFRVLGTYNGATVITDTFPATALIGGADSVRAPMGRGATIATWKGRQVWDRKIQIDGSAVESVEGMAAMIELNGQIAVSPSARYADGGRSVILRRNLGTESQWLKAFLFATKGRWRSFWLPTWRSDLKPVAVLAPIAAVKAQIKLLPPTTDSGNIEDLIIRAKVAGPSAWRVQFRANALDTDGEIDEADPVITIIRFVDGITTAANIATLIGASSRLELAAQPAHPTFAAMSGDDEFGPNLLTGGVAESPGGLIISDAFGEFSTWFPHRRKYVQIETLSGAVSYHEITSATTNGDGTSSIRLTPAPPATIGAYAQVSWLERCRWEADDQTIAYAGDGFSFQAIARSIQDVPEPITSGGPPIVPPGDVYDNV